MKHLRKFDSVADLNAAIANSTIGIIGLAYNNGQPVVKKKDAPSGPDYSEPFYINVRGAVTLYATSDLQMSTDKTNWTDTESMTLPTGKTYFRVATDQSTPLLVDLIEYDNSDYDIGGNINSLVTVDFANDTNCYSFTNYFSGKSKLKSAGNLILPATTLADNCYQHMFQNCTSLTTAPELPATTLTNMCYIAMFGECTNLNYIKCLATNISASDCTSDWTDGVASTGTFVKNPSMSSWTEGASGIPEGWTVENATA